MITRWVHVASRWLVMLSIAKLRVGQEAYQLSGVAQSLDAYYTGAGEADGRWVGGGARRLGLDGDVQPDDLRAVLAGLRPGAGGLTPNADAPRTHPRRVPGFDLTFKAPKSASVLYAVSDDPRVQGAMIEAGEKAMRTTIGWLEREAIRVQRGSHNLAWLATLDPHQRAAAGPRREMTSGVVAASFRHRTSRAGDPLLHWHVLVANLVEGADGRWSAFAHPDLYRHVRAAGEVFQAVFRDELTRSLGVEWRPGRHVPEIAGIPQALLDQFSKRSTEIEDWLAATGTPNDAAGRQAAVLATRRRKPEVEHERFDDGWKREAEAFGWGPALADELVVDAADRTGMSIELDGVWRLGAVSVDETNASYGYDRLVDPEEWIADLLRRDLTADRSTFTDADLVQAVTRRQGEGATIDTIERISARVLASPQAVAVEVDGEVVWTSRELLDVEARFITTCSAPATWSVPPEAIEASLAVRPTVGADQAEAVRTLCGAGAAVRVLVGPAGTGKTFVLDAIRAIHETSGTTVIGAAPSARAALELTAGAGIASHTLHSLLDQWRCGWERPIFGSLLVIDEAGMADIRTLEAVVTAQVRAGGQVLLVGDHHQLPEVGAGGGFAHAAHHAPVVAALTVNRRQRHDWEQAALAELRSGNVANAVAAYLTHDRVVVTDNPTAMLDAAVDRWFAARAAGLNPVLLAGTNDLVEQLNRVVTERLVHQGDLPADHDVYGAGVFRVGERVVVRRNATQHTPAGHTVEVANGQAGTITDAGHNTLTVQLDTGDHVVLDDRYLHRGGHVAAGYALTTHRAQGGTWDLAIAVGADGLYREGAYVELSRGAYENWLVLTDPEIAHITREATSDIERHDTGLTAPDDEPASVEDDLIQRIDRSRAKRLAHTVDPDAAIVDRLATTHSYPDLVAQVARARAAEHHAHASLGFDAVSLLDELEHTDHVARHLTIGQTVSPHDRNNVGRVSGIDDRAATATVHFVSTDGRHSTKTFAWCQLRLVGPGTARELPPAAAAHLARQRADALQACGHWHFTLARFGVEPGDAVRLQRAVDRHVERHAASLAAERPGWLTALVGGRPDDVAGAAVWDDTVSAIATWQLDHGITDHTHGLGGQPDATDHEAFALQLADTRLWLADTDRLTILPGSVPSFDTLHERLRQLDDSFATCPADVRPVIAQLTAGQLSIDDTHDLLREALGQQDARHQWIITNWPHIVEHHEIHRALDDLQPSHSPAAPSTPDLDL